MPRASEPPPIPRTIADLLKELGGIPVDRILLHPTPGTATERDVLAAHDRDGRLCELVDGVLVEKAMGFHESRLAGLLLTFINNFLMRQNLGVAAGADGIMKLTTGLVRIPDVSFVSWDRLPGRRLPPQPIPRLPIDLAVEVISKGNTKAEIRRKVREYFEAGARLVWIVDPRTRTVVVHSAPDQSTRLSDDQTLDGGTVLPGFALPLRDLFKPAGPDV